MATGAKRPAGVKTKEAIMEAARHLFLRQGYHATGMREIAHETGVSLSAVYNHFHSKEEIFEAILAERNLYATMAEALSLARGETVPALMASGFAKVMDALRDKQDHLLLLFIDILEFQGRHVAELAAGEIPRIFGFFRQLVQLGREKGELREISPILLGRAYLGLVFSSFVLEHVIPAFAAKSLVVPLRVENLEQGLVDILLRGVLQDPVGPKGG